MRRKRRPSFSPEDKLKREEKKNDRTSSFLFYVIVIFLIALVSLIFVFDQPKESWPQIITYVTTNPLLAAIVVSIVAFLAVDRFRELSDRVSSLSQRLFDQKNSTDKEIETAVEKLEAKLAAKWERVGNRIDQIEQENPWLISLAENELLVNIPTATAALKNVETLISTNEYGVAYEVLYNASKASSDEEAKLIGTTYDFEALATISYVQFDDAATADLLFRRAQEIALGRHRYWLARRIQFALFSGRLSAAFDLAKVLYDDLVPSYWEAVLRRFGQARPTIYPQDRELILSSLYPFLADLINSRKVDGGRRWFDVEFAEVSQGAKDKAEKLKELWEGRPIHEAELPDLEAETDLASSNILCHVAARRMRNSSDPCTNEIALLGTRPGLRLFGDLQTKLEHNAPSTFSSVVNLEESEMESHQEGIPDVTLDDLLPSASKPRRKHGHFSRKFSRKVLTNDEDPQYPDGYIENEPDSSVSNPNSPVESEQDDKSKESKNKKSTDSKD